MTHVQAINKDSGYPDPFIEFKLTPLEGGRVLVKVFLKDKSNGNSLLAKKNIFLVVRGGSGALRDVVRLRLCVSVCVCVRVCVCVCV